MVGEVAQGAERGAESGEADAAEAAEAAAPDLTRHEDPLAAELEEGDEQDGSE